MKTKHKKILNMIFSDPVNGGIEWKKIETLLLGLECQVIEGIGSSVTFEKDGVRAYFHRPHPSKEALRYRVKDAREFLRKIGVTP